MDPLSSTQPASTQPNPTPYQSSPVTPEHKSVGLVVSIIVIVVILILGAIYLFTSRNNEEGLPSDSTVAGDMNRDNAPDTSTAGSDTVIPTVTNGSDDLQSIEADLNISTQGLDDQNF